MSTKTETNKCCRSNPARVRCPSFERDGVPAGALVYDASLQAEPELLAAVRSATTLALNHERLRHELQGAARRGPAITQADRRDRRRTAQTTRARSARRSTAAPRRGGAPLAPSGSTPDDRTHRKLLSEGAAELDRALDELRELARGVYPPVLTESGLAAALTCLAERAPMAVEVRSTLSRRPPVSTELAAYFIVAEGIANASKHSGADLVEVRLDEVDRNLRILVSDDGFGSATQPPAGGLAGLRDRASALGGELVIDSPPGRGTTVAVTLPFVPEDTSMTLRGGSPTIRRCCE